MYIVSACLLGIDCRYDAGCYHIDGLIKLAGQGEAVPVCPEQLGGLSTPREPCEIKGGSGGDVLDGRCRIINRKGEDMTDSFVRGAMEALKLAEACGAKKAILKARSPSCGFGKIYDGTFTGKTVSGNGVTAELLIRNGIEVSTEEEHMDHSRSGRP